VSDTDDAQAVDANGPTDAAEACPDGGDVTAAASAATPAAANPTAVGSLFTTARAKQVLGVARREYRVLARARWQYGLALLFAAFSLAVVGLGGSGAGPSGAAALLLTLAELSVYLVPLAALALGYGTVVGASERGTLELLLSLPLPREGVLIGKFLGRAAAFATGVTVGLAAGGLLVAAKYGVATLPAYLHYLLTVVTVGVAFLSVGVCVSAVASDKARALGGALLAWAWFVLVYDLVALGAVVALDPPQWVLGLVVLGNPADALRIVVLSLVPASTGGVGATLAASTVPVWALVAGLLAWIVVPILVGGRLLASRA
jgi:Cu-processing system permease protein